MKGKNRKQAGKILLGTTLFLCVLFFAGCKKKQPDSGLVTQPPGNSDTTETDNPELSAFELANAKLVQERLASLKTIVAAKVGSQEITMDRAMVLIYFMEVRGNYYADYYEATYGSDYWNTVYDASGKTAREVFKEETMDTLIRYAILYDCAVRNGMELTAEEQKENEAYVERVKAEMTSEEAERGGFTTQGLLDACAWMMTAEKYYDRMTENLGITRESAAETINPEDYREYETEYLYLPTTYYDEQYQVCEESEEIIAARLERMKEYAVLLQQGETFAELLERDGELTYKQRLFRENGSGAETAYAEAAKKLKNGELTGPVKTEYGIYIIRMVDRDCQVSYEEAVDAAFEVKKSEAMEAAYRVLSEQYPTELNEEAWSEIVIGATVSLRE